MQNVRSCKTFLLFGWVLTDLHALAYVRTYVRAVGRRTLLPNLFLVNLFCQEVIFLLPIDKPFSQKTLIDKPFCVSDVGLAERKSGVFK